MPKIFHTITPDATYTFLSKETHDESKAEAHPEDGFVYAESEISDDEYRRLQSWHIEGDPEEGDPVDPTIGDM